MAIMDVETQNQKARNHLKLRDNLVSGVRNQLYLLFAAIGLACSGS